MAQRDARRALPAVPHRTQRHAVERIPRDETPLQLPQGLHGQRAIAHRGRAGSAGEARAVGKDAAHPVGRGVKRPTEADIDDWLERVLDGFPVVRSWRGLVKFILVEAAALAAVGVAAPLALWLFCARRAQGCK